MDVKAQPSGLVLERACNMLPQPFSVRPSQGNLPQIKLFSRQLKIP
uniref:Uncharacterized protein n=1 Tax=Anguilla anguilla TaxID=7936 RepID=A0A0E9QS48_ANGAN